jgi:hypothetical protein
MNPFMFVYAFLLFFVLTPGVLVYLPPRSGKITVALTHALVFALIWTLTHKYVWQATNGLFEGMHESKKMQ